MGSSLFAWRELLLVAIAGLTLYVVVAGVMLLRQRRQRRDSPGRGDAAGHFAVQPLRDEIAELRRQLAELRQEVEALQTVVPKENPTPYANAIQLAKGGQEPLAIAEHCGISRGEAELIAALYRKR
jgi:hypothetical protein